MIESKNIISWTAVILWIVLIFCFSAQPVYKSNSLSKKVTKVVIETAEKIAPKAVTKFEFDINRINHLIRKNAHFFVFLVLGILVINVLSRSGRKGVRAIAMALGICVLYAVSDEVHQLFVPGRGAQVKDVLIDSAGAIVGICIYVLASRVSNINKTVSKKK